MKTRPTLVKRNRLTSIRSSAETAWADLVIVVGLHRNIAGSIPAAYTKN